MTDQGLAYLEACLKDIISSLFPRIHKLAKLPSEVAPMIGIREAIWHLYLSNEFVLVGVLGDEHALFIVEALLKLAKGQFAMTEVFACKPFHLHFLTTKSLAKMLAVRQQQN